jgi:hypothetical protein
LGLFFVDSLRSRKSSMAGSRVTSKTSVWNEFSPWRRNSEFCFDGLEITATITSSK